MHPSGVMGMGMGMGGGALSAAVVSTRRWLSVRTANIFSREGISHARRVSWAPHTTDKKQGAFAKLARSNFNDPTPQSFFTGTLLRTGDGSLSATPMSLRE
ncbi:unnamed protein product [Phytomonas sp. Hart1]|nr:unnamed protein product [Phytomonas sp. Hart1]|eukprot:CCW72154.1 unnamed protein product [Phytomonas sp. isolate Hart1]